MGGSRGPNIATPGSLFRMQATESIPIFAFHRSRLFVHVMTQWSCIVYGESIFLTVALKDRIGLSAASLQFTPGASLEDAVQDICRTRCVHRHSTLLAKGCDGLPCLSGTCATEI